MKYFLKTILTIILLQQSLLAQQFDFFVKTNLPDSLSGKYVHCLEINKDDFFDLLVVAENQQGYAYLLLYNNKGNGFELRNTFNTNIRLGSYTLHDTDANGIKDLLISSADEGRDMIKIFLVGDDFSVVESNSSIQIPGGSYMKLEDINSDGKKEFFISGTEDGTPYLRIYTLYNGEWIKVKDSLEISATHIEFFDFNHDGFKDFFIRGVAKDGSHRYLMTWVGKDFELTMHQFESMYDFMDVSAADLNHDGTFDLVVSRQLMGDAFVGAWLSNDTKNFDFNFLRQVEFPAHRIKAADFNSDGKIDFGLTGPISDTAFTHTIYFSDSSAQSITLKFIVDEQYSDIDYDGDLDLVFLVSDNDNGTQLILYRNTCSTPNNIPERPAYSIGFKIFNYLFLVWERSADDHTPEASITYDVKIIANDEAVVQADFDDRSFKRNSVTHGNAGTSDFYVLRSFPLESFEFLIQPVDNAYHAGASVCSSDTEICTEIVYQNLELCPYETKELASPENALWFSLSHGFLQRGFTYTVPESIADTVVYVIPRGDNGCLLAHVTVIQRVEKETVLSRNYKFACKDSEIFFELPSSGYQDCKWYSSIKGFLAQGFTLNYNFTTADTIKASALTLTGCREVHTFVLNESQPQVSVNAESFTIKAGTSVQLMASGGISYVWSPEKGLDNPFIPDPVARPSETTVYTVLVTDSLGCQAQAQIKVIVELTAYLPELFTPNGDGANDFLKIYGLDDPGSFSFEIYDRNGNVVYKTTDPNQAANYGWDGSFRGVELPAGVYFWRVEGLFKDGTPLLLNGKANGKVILMR